VSGTGIKTEPYASLQLTPDSQPSQDHATQFFTGKMPFLLPNQQHQSTEGKYPLIKISNLFINCNYS